MKISETHLRRVIREQIQSMKVESVIDYVESLVSEKFDAVLTHQDRFYLGDALMNDFDIAGRFPTRNEIHQLMFGFNDDDEDLGQNDELRKLFPETTDIVESLWQTRGNKDRNRETLPQELKLPPNANPDDYSSAIKSVNKSQNLYKRFKAPKN